MLDSRDGVELKFSPYSQSRNELVAIQRHAGGRVGSAHVH